MAADSAGSRGRLELDDLREKLGMKAFPIHSSFYLGELALFAFVGLVTTGIFLAFFYEPSTRLVEFQGESVPAAFASVVQIDSLTMGLVARRVHHWSAHIMIAAIVVHMARVYFTGAYRRPRDVNWVIGSFLLLLTVMAAFVGYLLPFDEFAVTATAIGYQIISSIPWVGGAVARLAFAGPFPNLYTVPRFYSWHVMLIPLALSGLIALHLVILFKLKHTQHPRVVTELRERAGDLHEEGIVGLPLWPEQTLNMVVVFLTYAAGVSLLAAFVPVHPVEVYGPPEVGTPVMKPDWYLLWVFGVLKLVPAMTVTVLGGTVTAEFVGGIVIPGVVVLLMVGVPFIDERLTGDVPADPVHVETDGPFDRPGRTGAGVAAIAFFLTTSLAGYTTELGLSVPVMTAIVAVGTLGAGGVTYLVLRARERPGKRPVEGTGARDQD